MEQQVNWPWILELILCTVCQYLYLIPNKQFVTLCMVFVCICVHTPTHTCTPQIHIHTHTALFTMSLVAPGDYDALTNFRLGPFNNDVRQLSFNVSVVDDNIPENGEMFRVSLTLDPADQARLGSRVTVSLEVATVTIQDDDGKHFNVLSINIYIF